MRGPSNGEIRHEAESGGYCFWVMCQMTAKTKLSSIIQTVLLLGVEMGLDMADQNIDINLAWVHDELWEEKREMILRDALKKIERLSCVREVVEEE